MDKSEIGSVKNKIGLRIGGKDYDPCAFVLQLVKDCRAGVYATNFESMTSVLVYEVLRGVLGYGVGELVPQKGTSRGFVDYLVKGSHEQASTEIFVEVKKFDLDVTDRAALGSIVTYITDHDRNIGAIWRIGILTNLRQWIVLLSNQQISKLMRRRWASVGVLPEQLIEVRARADVLRLMDVFGKIRANAHDLRGGAAYDPSFIEELVLNPDGDILRLVGKAVSQKVSQDVRPDALRGELKAFFKYRKQNLRIISDSEWQDVLRLRIVRDALAKELTRYLSVSVPEESVRSGLDLALSARYRKATDAD